MIKLKLFKLRLSLPHLMSHNINFLLFTETTKQNHIQNLLKRATNMKKMLLKIRNEMKRNNRDIEHLINCKITKRNNGQSQQSKVDEHSDELCDSLFSSELSPS